MSVVANLVKNINAEKIVEFIRPFIPEKWSQTFSGYGTYAVGVLMILSAIVAVLGFPVPWVPPGTEGQWIAGGIAAFTVRRAIANQKTQVLEAIKENTELTTKVADNVTVVVEKTKKEGE